MNTPIDVEATPTPEPETARGQTMALERRAESAVARPLTIDQIHERLEFVRRVMKEEMRENQDYGKIPGAGDKPTLLQPGAQKLLMTFNLREQVKREVMRELPHPSVAGHREYEFTVSVFPAGMTPQDGWDGIGTCSTFESKYRYRKAERLCPLCHKPTVIKGKADYGGGYLCFAKKGGCGAKFNDDDPRITSQSSEETENEDPADCWNTARKMAFKRALVSAAINATNTSELWTQDVEDLVENRGSGFKKPPEARSARISKPTPPAQPPRPATTAAPGGSAQPKSASTPPGASQGIPVRPMQPAIFADEETRTRMIAGLKDCETLALEYFTALRNPSLLLPGETLADVPLRYVPVTKRQFELLMAAITDFGNGDEAKHPYAANPDAPTRKEASTPKPATTGDPAGSPVVAAAKAKNPEWFWDTIISVPRKGMKKVEYDKQPDTIRSLYDAMKRGDEVAQARLWGLVRNWKPEPRIVGDKTYKPTAADFTSRAALDDFDDYENKKPETDDLPM